MDRSPPPKPSGRIAARLGFALWLAVSAAMLCVFASQGRWVLVRNRNLNKHVVSQIGYFGYLAYDAAQAARLAWSELRLGAADAAPYRAFLAEIREANERAAPPHARGAGKHLIYVQMESVDSISARALREGAPLMPFLHGLRARSIDYANVIDNTGAGRTTDGEFMVLTSLPPVRGKPVYTTYDLDRAPSMPRVLREAGYYAFSIHGYNPRFWHRGAAHRQLGYEDSFFRDSLDASERIGWGISDRSVLQQAAAKIAASERPVFAHIVLLTNHHPYNHVARAVGRPEKTLVENHIDSLRYVDDSIRAFFETLEAEGILDDCLIAIYGDHDSGVEGRLRPLVELETEPLFRDEVPLILYNFAGAPRVVEKPAGLQDLPVVALQELGLPMPATFSGNALDSPLPTYRPSHGALSARDGELAIEPPPIDLATLTKLAILHPDKLEGPP